MQKTAPSLTDFVYSPLVSTGTRSPGNPTIAGAFLSAMATEGLEVGEEVAMKSGGGVERFVFIAGGILPVGAPHPEMKMLDISVESGEAHCRDPDSLLFHDVNKDVAAVYKPLLKCQPADGWVGNCTYCGWEKVPSSYLLTEHDRVLSPQTQEMCAGISGSEVIRIPAGHLPMLSDPKMLAEEVVACLKLEQ
ncbi:hypothetical protein BDW72DRAFT_213646 [Aspergillus terricola var. indicus]